MGLPMSPPSDAQLGREVGDQIGPQPVQQPAYVAVGPLIVPRGRLQLGGYLPMRVQRGGPGPTANRHAVRASSAVSFLRAELRRQAISSGFTGTTVNPASSNYSTSVPWPPSRYAASCQPSRDKHRKRSQTGTPHERR